MGIKGKTVFELTDVNTGEVEKYEDCNMITNGLQEFLDPCGSWGIYPFANDSVADFTLRILYSAAFWYLDYLRTLSPTLSSEQRKCSPATSRTTTSYICWRYRNRWSISIPQSRATGCCLSVSPKSTAKTWIWTSMRTWKSSSTRPTPPWASTATFSRAPWAPILQSSPIT